MAGGKGQKAAHGAFLAVRQPTAPASRSVPANYAELALVHIQWVRTAAPLCKSGGDTLVAVSSDFKRADEGHQAPRRSGALRSSELTGWTINPV